MQQLNQICDILSNDQSNNNNSNTNNNNLVPVMLHFNNNILLIHDYCEIDRALKHYYYNQSTSDCETCFCRDVADSTRVDY